MTKNLFIVGCIAVFAFIWFPTLDPSDIFFFEIISKIGIAAYLAWSVLFVVVAYFMIDGKGISGKINTLKKEIHQVI